MHTAAVFLIALVASLARTETAAEKLLLTRTVQPLRFSRAQHEWRGFDCSSCHVMPESGGFAQTETPPEKFVPTPPVQPIPLSHKQHAAQGLECSSCHEMPDPGKDAGIPSTATCMACHTETGKDTPAIKLLTEYDKKKEAIPWKRLYHVEGYVFFTHKTHVTTGKITCDACHGPIQEMDVTRKVKETGMSTCMECHKERNAPQNCGTSCHEPV